jgi:hypothetical protein
MMKLEVKRFEYGTNYTVGKLYIDGVYQCFTLEDRVREKEGVPVEQWKVQGETAIPTGTYKVTIDYSQHFQKAMPHVLDVIGFEGIRIHSGNTDKDTEGCILLGSTWAGTDFISNSRLAFDAFFAKLSAAVAAKEDVEITVS